MKQITLEKKTGLVEHYNLIFREQTDKGNSMTSISLEFGDLENLHFIVGEELRK